MKLLYWHTNKRWLLHNHIHNAFVNKITLVRHLDTVNNFSHDIYKSAVIIIIGTDNRH
jgi:hypothetical protein